MTNLSKGEKITCSDKETMLAALVQLEEKGFKWINGNENPTQWLPWKKLHNHQFPDSINFHSEGKICRGLYPSGKETIQFNKESQWKS